MNKITNRSDISSYFEIFIYLSAKQKGFFLNEPFWGVEPLSVIAAKFSFMT